MLLSSFLILGVPSLTRRVIRFLQVGCHNLASETLILSFSFEECSALSPTLYSYYRYSCSYSHTR